MTVSIVRPDGTAAGSGNYTISGGSATIHQALNDNSDSTFITKNSALTGQASTIVDFGTTTITASQRVKQVRVRARCLTPTANGKINIYLGSRVNNQNYFHSPLAVRGLNSITTFTGAYFTASPDGSAWSQASINGLRAKVTEYADSSDRGNVYELYIDVDISSQPSVSVTAPTGTITTTTAPDINWTYTDTDNEPQAFYEIKIFDAATYGAGGFSADTSTPTWTSGIVGSSDNSDVVGSLLLPATYRAYIRAAKSINGEPFWSTWSYSQFTISYTAPTVPTLVASWSSTLGKASFTMTGATLVGLGYVSQYYEIQRSDDGGVTYDFIRNGTDLIPNVSFVATAVDYEAPRGITARYRCRSVGVDSSSFEFPSAWGTVQQVLITNDGTWWFKVIESPTLNQGSIRVLKEIDVNIEEPGTIFRPLGSDRPIYVTGLIQGEDGGYDIKTISEAEWDLIYPVLTYQGIILVQDPYGNQKYIRIIDRSWTAESIGGTIQRDATLRYVEVDG